MMKSWEKSISGNGSCNSFAKDDDHDGSGDVQQPRFRSYGCNRFSCNSKLSHALATTSTMALIMAVCLLLPLVACNADATPDALANPAVQEENNDIIANLDDKSATSETPSFLESSLGGGGLEENIRSEVKNEIKTVQTASPAILNALNVFPENEQILLIEYPKAAATVESAVESSAPQRNDSQIETPTPVGTQCDANIFVCQWNKNQNPTTTPASTIENVDASVAVTAATALDLPAEVTIQPIVDETTILPELVVSDVAQQQAVGGESMREPRTLEGINVEQQETAEVGTEVAEPILPNTQAETVAVTADEEATLVVQNQNLPSSETNPTDPQAQTSVIETNTLSHAPETVLSSNSVDDVVEPKIHQEPTAAVVQTQSVQDLPAQPTVLVNDIQDTPVSTAINEINSVNNGNQSNESSDNTAVPSLQSPSSSNPIESNTEGAAINSISNTVPQIAQISSSVASNEPSNALEDSSSSEETVSTEEKSIKTVESDIAALPPVSNSNEISKSEESNEDLPMTTTPPSVQSVPNSHVIPEDDTLSIIFEEPLTATEPPILLENLGAKNIIEIEDPNLGEFVVTHTTLPPQIAIHNVIKKEGVDSIEVDTDTISENTTPTPLIEEPVEQPLELGVASNEEINPQSDTIEVSPSTPQPEISTLSAGINEQSTQLTPTTRAANDITELSVVFPGKGDEDVTTTSKGSRSINSLGSDFSGHQKASINFDIYPAGQTINGNLAEEGPNGIGKALPTHRLSEESSNRSTLIIALCSVTAVLFVVVSVGIFLISFQRQHGTLDIEMQEQRCGKDNVNDEVAETCVKLLEIELPSNSGLANQTDAEAEIEECL